MLIRLLAVAFLLSPLAYAQEKTVQVSTGLYYCFDTPDQSGLVAIGQVMHEMELDLKTKEDLAHEEEVQISAGHCVRPTAEAPLYMVHVGGFDGSPAYPYRFLTFRMVPKELTGRTTFDLSEVGEFPLIHVPIMGLAFEEGVS